MYCSQIVNKIYLKILEYKQNPKEILSRALSLSRRKDGYGSLWEAQAWCDEDVRLFSFLYKYGNEELNDIIIR